MKVKVINGRDANRMLRKEGKVLVSGFSYWYGYVSGKGVVRDINGRPLCFTTKRVAEDMFNSLSNLYFYRGEVVSKPRQSGGQDDQRERG